MGTYLLINPRSGGVADPAALAAAAQERGIEAHVLAAGDDPYELARASGADVVGIAGGDGSLGPVAAAAIEIGAAFVCVPAGTRNHFARDAGLDCDDPVAALDAYRGSEHRIDAGRAGGRVFVNNVSFGAYAGLVHGRLLAALREPTVFVGNNRYHFHPFRVGARERLDEGVLQKRTAHGVLPWQWDEECAPRFVVSRSGGRVRAAIDGEAVVLDAPVEIESLTGALRLLTP